jgi:hypothetical protein
MDFRTSKGFAASIRYPDIVRPGLERFRRALSRYGRPPSMLACLFRKYHYGFNLLEQIMLMTVPHTVTEIGDGRYIINLWSWCGYLLVDCRTKEVAYHILDEADGDLVLGTRQWFDPKARMLYGMSYSLTDSFERVHDPTRPVAFRIWARNVDSGAKEEVWSGELADYMHDLVLSGDRRYCVACELGMYRDNDNHTIPSRVLVAELGGERRHWTIDRFIVAAHAQFDPAEPDMIYFSNHNFQFEHTSLHKLIKQGSYSVKFNGPASIFKYRLTPDGPDEVGVFTRPDFYRLTNMHVFFHRGRKVIAAMGFPDEVFLIDAGEMSFIRKLTVSDYPHMSVAHAGEMTLIGTIAPSPDGAKLFVQTTRSFQVVDIESGESDFARDCGRHHSCFNHMHVSKRVEPL